MTASDSIRARPCAGEADLVRIDDLTVAYPDNALHLADLPWRLCSPAARTPDWTRLWEDVDGTMLAWAVLQFPWHCLDFVVSPEGHRRGVAAPIMDWATGRLEAEVAQRGAPLPFYVSARASDAARMALVEQYGFGRDGYQYLHLSRDLEEAIPSPRLPAGFTIRSLAGEPEIEPYVALHRAAFNSTNMTARWRAATLRHPRYTPELDLVVVAPDGVLAGFCVSWLTPPLPVWGGRRVAQVEPMGVLPAYQRRGLARALLLTALERARALGAVRMEVDSEGENDPALRAYHRVGFQLMYEAPFFLRRFG